MEHHARYLEHHFLPSLYFQLRLLANQVYVRVFGYLLPVDAGVDGEVGEGSDDESGVWVGILSGVRGNLRVPLHLLDAARTRSSTCLQIASRPSTVQPRRTIQYRLRRNYLTRADWNAWRRLICRWPWPDQGELSWCHTLQTGRLQQTDGQVLRNSPEQPTKRFVTDTWK